MTLNLMGLGCAAGWSEIDSKSGGERGMNMKIGGMLNRWTFWLGAIAMLALAGFGYRTLHGKFSHSGTISGQPTDTVKEGRLTISVVEKGTVQAREQLILKNEIEGQTTLLYLIEEGTRVKKGDLLVELDASSMQDDLVDRQIATQNAEADFVSARENLEVVKNQAKADVDQARLDHDFSLQDLRKYLDGEYPKQIKEAESEIKVTEEELKRADEKVKWSDKLAKKSYISQSELDSDKLANQKAKLKLELAQGDLKLLKDFTFKREVAQLRSDCDQTSMALERAVRKAAANVAEAAAKHQAGLSKYEREKLKLDKLQQQIAKAKIYAPADGLVVYATSARMGGGYRGNDQPLAEGQTVRERQDLIYLPTADSYVAAVKVHETSLEKIRPGLPVQITVDALPGRVYTGKVASIAPLPDPMSLFMNPDLKVYNTQILIEGAVSELRTGMSCQAEIVVDHYEKAMYVPVQAVVRIGDRPTVYVNVGHEWNAREVVLGLDNNSVIRIESGLKPGEEIWLAPPLAAAGSGVRQQKLQPITADIGKMIKEAPPKGAAPAPIAIDGKLDLDRLTAEQRDAMRQNYASLTPEQKAALQKYTVSVGGPGDAGIRDDDRSDRNSRNRNSNVRGGNNLNDNSSSGGSANDSAGAKSTPDDKSDAAQKSRGYANPRERKNAGGAGKSSRSRQSGSDATGGSSGSSSFESNSSAGSSGSAARGSLGRDSNRSSLSRGSEERNR